MAEAKPIENIVVTGKKRRPTTTSNFGALMATNVSSATRNASQEIFEESSKEFSDLMKQPVKKTAAKSEFEKLLQKPLAKSQKAIDNIIVVGKKSTAARAVAGGLASGIIGVADVIAMISDKVSQKKLDDTFAELMAQDVRPRPDTPLKTIPKKKDQEQSKPKPIDEIIVRGKRKIDRSARTPTNLRQLLRVGMGSLVPRSPVFELEPPKLPKKAPQPRLRTQPERNPLDPRLPLGILFARLPDRLPATLTDPIGIPPTGRPVRTREPEPNPRAAIFPRLQTQPERAAFCPPCPKESKRRKKRNICYKQLVKQRRDPRQDIKYNWVRIDCDTGRELK